MSYFPIKYPNQPDYRKKFIWIAVILAAWFVLCLFAASKVWGAEASYYTYDSCRKEGSSGVFTASGERFNENALTAAMWGVPFGTLVRVTNLANGKSVVVRITDRGPSKRLVKIGRIIDLSKMAFKRIASLKDGVIKVKVEIL